MNNTEFTTINRKDLFQLYSNFYYYTGFDNLTLINGVGNCNAYQIVKYFTLKEFCDIYSCDITFCIDQTTGNYNAVLSNFIYEIEEFYENFKVPCSKYISQKYFDKDNTQNDIKNGRVFFCEVIYNESKESKYGIFDIDEFDSIAKLKNESNSNWYRGVKPTDIVFKLIEYKNDFKNSYKNFSYIDNRNYPYYGFKKYNWLQATGIGCISGDNYIRCLDIDNCSSIGFVKSLCKALNLPEDYEWVVKSGSNNGFHIWVKIQSLPTGLFLHKQAKDLFDEEGIIVLNSIPPYQYTFERIEIRWKAHCVLPPSLCHTGNQYKFTTDKLPKNKPVSINPDLLFKILNILSVNSELDYNSISKRSIDEAEYRSGNTEYIPQIMYLDIETTGLAKDNSISYSDLENWPFIVQLSYILSGFKYVWNTQTKNFILKPNNFKINISSSEIHGITNADAINDGFDRKEVFNYILKQLEHIDYIVGHNIDFDINVLKCEILRNTNIDEKYIDKLFGHIKCICTMKESVDYCKISSKNGYKWATLNELYFILFGKSFVGQHNALNDVKAAKECFEKLEELKIIKIENSNLTQKEVNYISSLYSSFTSINDDLPF